MYIKQENIDEMNIVDKNNDAICLNPNNKTVLYVDANNMCFRAYYAAEAMKLNPVHVLLNMAYSSVSFLPNEYAFAIFDGENNKDSRLAIYPEYKANREEKSEEEKQSIDNFIKKAHKVFKVLGYITYVSNGIEADDVVGILAKRSAGKNWNVIAMSSDKDYKQLCQYSPYINIYQSSQNKQSDNTNGKNFEITNQNNFEQKFNIPLTMMVDYLSLTGDSIDGVKGVDKVGPKTAQKWLNEIGNIETIKQNLDKIKDGAVKNNLVEAINNGLLDRNIQLIQFHFHKENQVIIPREEIKKSQIDVEELDEFCINNNMKQFREKYIEPLIQSNQYTRPQVLQTMLKIKLENNENQENKNLENKVKARPF